MKRPRFLALLGLVCVLPAAALAARHKAAAGSGKTGGDFGEVAPDFPPGVFSDGGHYDLADYRGKLLVVFFFESECPTCKGMVPKWNKLTAEYKDRPVRFLAIGPHNTLAGVKQYVQETRLAMPVFADNLNVMETLYGQTISLENVRQWRLIGPDGKVVGYEPTEAAIDKALAGVHWKYKDGGYDPKLNGIVDALEWNQYGPAVKGLHAARKASPRSLAASAEKLYGAVHAEGEGWKSKADELAATDPVAAFDLYAKVANVFAGDDLAKAVADPMKALRSNKAVVDEMAARQQYAQLYSAVPRARFQQREQVAKFCEQIADKYPGSPTATKAQALSVAIATAPSAGT